MKVLATFQKPEEANLLRSVLAGSGIPSYVRDEYVVAMDFFYSKAVGGVKLEVAEKDCGRVCDVWPHGGEPRL